MPPITELTHFIQTHRQCKDILLMSHTVLGYPSLSANRQAVDALVRAGIEIIELQFPFSEPIADGPTLLTANHTAVQSGIAIADCFNFAAEITQRYPQTRFVVMTYLNILFKYGMSKFVRRAAQSGLAGCIVPDLPPAAAADYIRTCQAEDFAAIFLVTPRNSPQRIEQIIKASNGLVYCVARTGVTGDRTQFSETFANYIQGVRQLTTLPLAVGFGVQSREDVLALSGLADVAVVGSQAVKLHIDQGQRALEHFMHNLRTANGSNRGISNIKKHAESNEERLLL